MAAKKDRGQDHVPPAQEGERKYIPNPAWPPRGGRIRYPDDTAQAAVPGGGKATRVTLLTDFIGAVPNHGKLIDFA